MPPRENSQQKIEEPPWIIHLKPETHELFVNDEERFVFEKLIGGSFSDAMNLVAMDLKSGANMLSPAHRQEIFVSLLNNAYPPTGVDYSRDFKGTLVWMEMLEKTQQAHKLPLPMLIDLAEFSAGISPLHVLNSQNTLDPVIRDLLEARRMSVRQIAERIYNGEKPMTEEDEEMFSKGMKILPIMFKSQPESGTGYETSFHSLGPGTPLVPHAAKDTRDKIAQFTMRYGIPPAG